MSNNNLIIVFFTIICLLLVYRKYNSTRIDPDQLHRPKTQEISQPQIIKPKGQFPTAAEIQNQTLAKDPKAPAPLIADFNSALNEIENKSTETLNDFKKLAQLGFTLPSGFNFTKIDMSIEKVEGIYGVSSDAGQGLSILASYLPANIETVRKYLDEGSTDIPNLKGKGVVWNEKYETFPSIAGSKISGTIVWQGSNAREVFAAAYLEREDKIGRYIFIFSSNNKNALNNDGYFESLLAQVKAQ